MFMNTECPCTELFRIVMHPTNGVVGLVDELLLLAHEQGLELEWNAGGFRARSLGGEWQEVNDIVVRKSVFRAILARLAVLCNQRKPGSVSPYGGEGELSIGPTSENAVHVSFINTSAEHSLRLSVVVNAPALPATAVSVLPSDSSGRA